MEALSTPSGVRLLENIALAKIDGKAGRVACPDEARAWLTPMLRIEKAKREDARAVWDIRNAAILDQCTGHYSKEALAIWTGGGLPASFIEDVEKRFYVAMLNDEIVGTGAVYAEAGRLDAVFVHPAHMRRGIGTKIVQFLESVAVAHGLEALNLESTLNAAPFYRTCGFEGNEVSTYVSPRGVSLDCIRMVKSILPNK
jgi:N-acetylglutamate synthase-like GNAT family acetyltransferase